MAKLRHVAMVVDDIEKTASFYEKSFDMRRVRQSETTIGLTDGYMNVVIIHSSNPNMAGTKHRGLHHMGFLIDDLDGAAARVEGAGAVYHGGPLGTTDSGPMTERKYADPNGLMFDIATADHARRVWHLTPEGSSSQ